MRVNWPPIGRSEELNHLRSAFEEPQRGNRCVLVTGDPGIGKSTLLAALRELSQDSGARVLSVHGVEAERNLPFAGVQQLLSPLNGHLDSLPAVQRAAAETATGLTAGDPPKVFLVGLAALGLVERAAIDQSVVILIDDLTWVDQHTQIVLGFVARRLSDRHIAIVAAAQPGYDGVLAEVSNVVELGPLTCGDSEELLLRSHPDLSAATKSHILSRARGNPLALIELPKALPRGFRAPADDSTPTLPLPRKLRRAFGGRLLSLPPTTRDALLVAATYGGTQVAIVLDAASRLHGAPVTLADLEQAAGLLDVTGPHVTFRHPLIRSAVMAEEPASRHLRTHAALGDVLAPGTPARAWHRASAAHASADDIADELAAMAPMALARGSLSTVVQFLERAAELTSDPRRRGRRYLDAATHSLSVGDAVTSDELLRQAGELPLSRRDRLALEWAHEVLDDSEPGTTYRLRRLCQLAGEAVALGDHQLALDLLFAAAMRCWWSDSPAVTREILTEAVDALSEHRVDPRFLAALTVAEPAVGVIFVEEMLNLFDRKPDRDAHALRVIGFAAHVLGDSPRAADYLARAEAELRRIGAANDLVQLLLTEVPNRLATGDWSRADAAIDEARRFGDETDQPVWDIVLLECRAHSAALRGHLTEALELAGRAELAATRQQIAVLVSGAQLARGCAWAGVGRFSEAYTELRGLLLPLEEPQPQHRQLFPALMFLAEAATHTNQRSDAASIIGPWRQRAATDPAPNLLVHLLYAQAVLAADDEAEDLYVAALTRDLQRWPFVRAMLQSAYGAWLRRQRRIVESRPLIRSALLTFDHIGARGWAARARSELAAAGERHEAPGGSTDLGLSPQQLQIAQLAARGLSNREIGEQLFLSPRTIGSHLYRIFPRLGVTSRIQLAQRLETPTR